MATVLLKQARLPRVWSFQIKNKIKPESFSCPSANSSESWQVDEVSPRFLRVRDSVCRGFWLEASPVESGSPQAAIYQEVHPHRLRYALFLPCFSALHRIAFPSNLENVPLSPFFLIACFPPFSVSTILPTRLIVKFIHTHHIAASQALHSSFVSSSSQVKTRCAFASFRLRFLSSAASIMHCCSQES